MLVKNLLQKSANLLGYELSKKKQPRLSLTGVLKQVSKQFQPQIIFDVGAAFGSWTRECSSVFPLATYVLIEPLAEYEVALQKLAESVKNTHIIKAVANSLNGEVSLNVHEDLVGSSLKNEVEGSGVDGVKRTVKSVTLDTVAHELNLAGSCLVKIDVQGAELGVLEGAKNILLQTECLILEVSLIRSFYNGADFYEVIEYMKKKGFVVYDVASLLYRPYDNALCQMDLVFVREQGIFRNFLGYATPLQRKEQNAKFQKFNNDLKS